VTFKELIEEVQVRGFSYESEARIKRWINQTYREVCDFKPWPFLKTTKEGAAPLTIADLGHVLAVADVAANALLRFADLTELTQGDPNLESEGSPSRWFLDGSKIAVYPISTRTIKVTYVKTPADLKEPGDEPVVPAAYQGVIVDGACAKAYKPTDNFEAMQYVRQEFDRSLRGMVHALMRPNYDGHRRILLTGSPEDYA